MKVALQKPTSVELEFEVVYIVTKFNPRGNCCREFPEQYYAP